MIRPAAAVSCGVLYFLGFTGFGIWPLIFVFLVPLLWAIRGLGRPLPVLGLGAVSGTVAMMGGYYWVVHLLQVFAGLALPWALLGYLLLTLYQGGVLALLAWLVQRSGAIPAALSVPVVLVLLESAYPFLFPNWAGNALYTQPLFTQPVELFGMAAVSVLVGCVNGTVFDVTVAWVDSSEKRGLRVLRAAAPGLFMLALTVVYSAIRIPMVERVMADADTMKVALIQTNLGENQMNKRASEFIRTHQEMTREAVRMHPDLDLVVWPESGFNRAIPRSRNMLSFVSGTKEVPLLFGAITYEYVPKDRRAPEQDVQRFVYNSAILTSSTGAVLSRYDKIRLLMFGETLPFVETFPQVKKWFPRSGTLTRGQTLEHMKLGDTELLPLICYEDLMPSLVRELWAMAGPAEALVNITNDSWYGDTHEPRTHLALATFRSIETRRPMIRSTNTGISAIVDPVGRIVKRSKQWERETLVAEVPLIRDGGSTLFMRLGNVWVWVSVGFVGWWSWPRRRD